MGREIRRVPLDFDWPLEQPWKGWINPYSAQKCRTCDGDGSSPEFKEIVEDWYGQPYLHRPTGSMYRLSQEEVDLLDEEGRLRDLTHTWTKETGWSRRLGYTPTAQEVNAWAKRTPMAHDAVNQWIVCEHRAKKAGVKIECPVCGGDGCLWFSDDIRVKHESFYDKERYSPPTGEGWQVWETVSEGSPVTPVFATAEELVDYLVEKGDAWCQQRPGESPPSREAAEAFVMRGGWVPSATIVDGELRTGIDCAAEAENK